MRAIRSAAGVALQGSDMNFQISRRGILFGAAAMVCGGRVTVVDAAASAVKVDGGDVEAGKVATSGAGNAASRIAALEKRAGGRLGVEALDTATGRRIQHRSDERFGMCSTFKFLAAAAILQRVDLGTEHLDRRIEYGESDLLGYAPVSKEHVKEGGMTLVDICAAAVQWSDNTAANLILKVLSGPEVVTAFIRSTGDNVTRLDNTEPEMNIVGPGEVKNTTTAASMVGLLSSVVLGRVLSADSRTRLQGWMLDAKVGEHRLPAGLPNGWRIAHKTGTGSDQANDVGVVWPPNRAPIIVAALYSRGGTRQQQRENVLRDVGRIVAASF
jgi:beta-lactamase class A